MSEVRRRRRAWLAVPAAALAVLGITIPAQAQVHPDQSTRPATSVTTSVSLRSLPGVGTGHLLGGGGRWVVRDPRAYRQAEKTGNWVHTPDGLYYKTCVYSAANHAVLGRDEITAPSGARQHITPCTHPVLVPGPAAHDPVAHLTSASAPLTSATTGTPCTFGTGGVWWAASCNGSAPDWATSFDQLYAVPTNPAKDGALIFLWGGMESANGTYLLQDVLTWGANGNIVTNPNIWYVTNWYLAPNNDIVHGSSIHVGAGDTIQANLTSSNCNSAGACTWLESSADETNGRSTTFTVTSPATFDLLIGAVMEVPASTVPCDETPANGHAAFRKLTIQGNGDTITPTFGISTPDPHCGVSIRQADNGADILWTP